MIFYWAPSYKILIFFPIIILYDFEKKVFPKLFEMLFILNSHSASTLSAAQNR